VLVLAEEKSQTGKFGYKHAAYQNTRQHVREMIDSEMQALVANKATAIPLRTVYDISHFFPSQLPTPTT